VWARCFCSILAHGWRSDSSFTANLSRRSFSSDQPLCISHLEDPVCASPKYFQSGSRRIGGGKGASPISMDHGGTKSLTVYSPYRAYFNVPAGTDVLGDLKSVLEGLLTRA